MRGFLRFGMGVALGAAGGLVVFSSSPAPLAFDRVVVSPQAGTVERVNVLGNGTDDLALGLNGDFLFARVQGRLPGAFGVRSFPAPISVQGAVDVDGDGLDEVGVAVHDTTRGMVLELLDRAGATVDSLGPFTGPRFQGRPWNGAAFPVGAVRRADGARLLLAIVVGEWHPPRAIVAYDHARKRMAWEFAFGAFPMQAELMSMESAAPDTARPLLIVGTAATDNAGTGPPFDDSDSYLLALDADGAKVWALRTGGQYSRAQFVGFVRHVGRERAPTLFVTMHEHAAENPRPARLLVVDAREGRVLRERAVPTSFGMPRLLSEAPPRFVVGDAEGNLAIYDDSLRTLWSRREPMAIEAWACDDLDGDGEREVIASTEREGLVLDDHLRVRGRFPLHGAPRSPVRILPRRTGVSEQALVSVDDRVLDWRARRVSPMREPGRWALVALAGLVVGALASLRLPSRRGARRGEPASVREFLVEHLQIGHEVFDTKGPVEALRRWVQQVHADLPARGDPREAARDHLRLVGVPAIRRYLARAAALRGKGPSWVAATRLLDDVERRVAAGPLDASAAMELVRACNDLQSTCQRLHEEEGAALGCRADVVAQDALRSRQRALAEAGIASSFTGAPRAAVPVLFDPDELREIVGELLDNAARQLARRPDAEVHVSVGRDEGDPRWVVIEVADTGPGIPHEQRERIFEASFSTRHRGGFGLVHARELARAWRGSLALAPSERGARFQLRVRVLAPFGAAGAP